MEDSLYSIRPEGDETLNARLTFLHGRDPSIVAYGQAIIPNADSKKNLVSLFENEELECSQQSSTAPSLSISDETIKVYLRMKPFPPKMKLSKQEVEAYQILDSNTLLTKLPSLDSNTSSLKRPKGRDTISRKYTFTGTFGPETTQLQLFEHIIKQQMTEFLTGRSSTVMSYGTTNAGKSYTLQGTTASPGIIPRALEFVFSNIKPRPTPCYKPIYNTDVVSLDGNDRAYEMELKTKLLSFGSTDKNQYIQAYRRMQQLLQNESPLRPSETSNANYSVWVSFAEIYNETIYDLLSNDCQKKRPPLKLAADSSGKAFIKGLKSVCVNSGSEAYQLLMAGQYNLKVAATALNMRSSRSHCIFTIKLLKYHTENLSSDVEVSTFSFCDLAGSERLKKTLNAGERLKEAQNINTSLLVLGRCLKSTFDGQSAKLKHEVIAPFRESKLTRLFQNALAGKELIALIVNINPLPNLYVETQNVLNFSAIAKQIVVEPVIRVKRRASTSRFSQMVSRSMKTVTDWDVTEAESIGEEESALNTDKAGYVDLEDYEEVVRENEKLKKEAAQLRSAALNTEFEIRQEMSNIYSTMIKNLETNFKNRLQDVEEQQEDMLEWSVKQVKDYYKEKLSKISSRKRSHFDSDEESDEEVNVEELEAKNEQLTAKVESLKKIVKDLRESKEKVEIQNNKNAFELSLAKKDLDNYKNLLIAAQNDIGCGDEASTVIEELKKQLSARDEQIKSLKEYLNEAKAEWIRTTEVESEIEEALKRKEEELLESQEKITDLTEQLDHANACLAESTKTVETLEDKLDIYATKLSETEEQLEGAESRWKESNASCMILSKEKEELQRMLDNELARADKTVAESCTENEKLSESEKLSEELRRELDELKDQLANKNEMLDSLNKKLSDGEAENALLKNRLDQNGENTKMLREELNLTKGVLSDITEQINTLKKAEAVKVGTAAMASQTSFVNDEPTTENENMKTSVKVEQKEIHLCRIKLEQVDDEDQPSPTEAEDDLLEPANDNERISEDERSNERLEQLTIEYNDLRTQYLYETLKVKELSKELEEARNELICKSSVEVNDKVKKEPRDSMKSVENEEQISSVEYEKIVKELEETTREKEILENRFLECKTEVEKLRIDIEERREEARKKTEELAVLSEKLASGDHQLFEVTEKLRETSEKCLTEHVHRITQLEKDISAAEERNLIKEQLLEAHFQRISKLEKDLESAEILEKKVTEFEDCVKRCEDEKACLEKELKENREKILSLENELQASMSREEEKGNETLSLQKEMKMMIKQNSECTKRDGEMEKELKKMLRDLTATQKALDDANAAFKTLERSSQEKIDVLEMRVKAFEENASYLAVLQNGAEKREAENERLRIETNELRRKIEEKDQEMESFKKNRDIAMQRYEGLVKQLQEDAQRDRREVTRYQRLFTGQSTPTPHKEEVRKLKDELRSKTSLLEQMQDKLKRSESTREEKENERRDNIITTSEDEATVNEVRSSRKKGRRNVPASITSDNSVIYLSGSESKRVTRQTNLQPPASVEKRKPRKKKLFAAGDEACMDVSPTDNEKTPKPIIRSPLSSARSLRSRRK